MHQNVERPYRLCHRSALQQRRLSHRVLLARWPHVRLHPHPHTYHISSSPYSPPRSRIWSLPSGQCLKTLAEGHNAIWYEKILTPKWDLPTYSIITCPQPTRAVFAKLEIHTLHSPRQRHTAVGLPDIALLKDLRRSSKRKVLHRGLLQRHRGQMDRVG